MALKKVTEAAYLTAENHWRYRTILRYFFIQHERMREFIFPEEIYAYLKDQEEFSDYEEESLHLDLDQLVRWGNLNDRQEMGRSKTIEEFKKKRFRYQCTPYTVEFERMLIQMEGNDEAFGGSLERTQFERLYASLKAVEKVVDKQSVINDEEANQLWEDVQPYFRKIVQNTSDYIAYINSEEVEERMQTEAFLVYKDQFTTYLREFIRAMQSTAEQIKSVLSQLPSNKLYEFFQQVDRHKSQARLQEWTGTLDDPYEEYTGKWDSLHSWFRGTSHGGSEAEMLLERTTEAIRRITRVVQRMGERNQNFRSRKEDYLHLAKWFDSLNDSKEAHKLFATAFGISHTRHYHIDHQPTDNIYTDVWEEQAMVHTTKPMIRHYREKTRAGTVVDRSKEREKARQQYVSEKQKEREWLEKYMNKKEINLESIGKVEPVVRKIFLSWIGKAMGQSEQTIQTELGIKIKVHHKEGRIVLHADDGDLEMPNISFELIEEGEIVSV